MVILRPQLQVFLRKCETKYNINQNLNIQPTESMCGYFGRCWFLTRDSHFLPIACDFRSPCLVVPNLRYSPWVFAQGCVGDLNSIKAYRPSLYDVVKTQRVLHQRTCTREPERKQRCKKRSPHQELWFLPPQVSVPRGLMSWELRNRDSMLSPLKSTVSCWDCLWRNAELLFDIKSSSIYFIGCRCKFWIKNENVWTELDINLPGYSKYH